MGCAASTDAVPGADTGAPTRDTGRPAVRLAGPVSLGSAYELAPGVALRRERFGALAYSYADRRLTFLKSPELAALVESLGDHRSLVACLEAQGVPPSRWPALQEACAQLLSTGVLRAR
jgi:putative mycofactocin binding protein MftB